MKHLYNKPKSWSRYLKDAAPIYLVSLIGIVMSYFLFFGKNYFQQFALLAAIIVTVPHIIIIHKLYGGKKIASITKNTL